MLASRWPPSTTPSATGGPAARAESGGFSWTEEATARLNRVPAGFMRDMTREEVERVAPPARRHRSQRSRRRVRRLCLPRSAGCAWLRPEHEPAAGNHGQRAHGVVLSLDEARHGQWLHVHHGGPTGAAPTQLHPVLQRSAAPLGNRLLFSGAL